MMYTIINVAFILFILILLIKVFIKHEKCKKRSEELIGFLMKQIDFLTELNRKQEIIQLKKSILLYTDFQVVLKMCNCDFISFFKYDYSQKYLGLHFLLTIDNTGTLLHDSVLYDLPLTGGLLTLDILNSNRYDIGELNIELVKTLSENLYDVINRREINKIYYKNVYKYEASNPIGFIAFSFKDKDALIDEEMKPEIIRISNKIKNYI